MDATACILHFNLNDGRKLFPFNLNGIALFRVVKGIFDNITDCLYQLNPVTGKNDMIVS